MGKYVCVVGGGTFNFVRSHFAVAAAAYGETARAIHAMLEDAGVDSRLVLTKMACAGKSKIETNDDLLRWTNEIVKDPDCVAIVFNAAVTDFDGQAGDLPSGKYQKRLESRAEDLPDIKITPAAKIVPLIKAARPDLFLVTFKTTTHADDAEQLHKAKRQMDGSRADLVLANDTGTRRNMLMGRGHEVLTVTHDRNAVLKHLVQSVQKGIA